MSRIFVAGLGAVSPAGWNVAALRDALGGGEPLPLQSLARPGRDKPLRARLVPDPPVRPEFLAHPRLRRLKPSAACAWIPTEKISGWASSSACNPVACNIPAAFMMKH
jgi:hypothetical protein